MKSNTVDCQKKHEKNCIKIMKRDLFFANERMLKIAEQIVDCPRIETKKLPAQKTCRNASSDVIESVFGLYKSKKTPNPLHGVTPFVLLLPLRTRTGAAEKAARFDFRSALESVFMSVY
jgi:hypothetical protein